MRKGSGISNEEAPKAIEQRVPNRALRYTVPPSSRPYSSITSDSNILIMGTAISRRSAHHPGAKTAAIMGMHKVALKLRLSKDQAACRK